LSPGTPPVIEVLVVDDSAVVRQALSGLLGGEAGVRVSTASDPLVAMAKMRRHRPHVILLDLEMPRMDGLTFLKQIMASDPLPVVVCSGFAGPGTQLAVRALAAGAVDVFPKPSLGSSGSSAAQGLLEVVRAAAQARVGPPRVPRTATLPAIKLPSATAPAATAPRRGERRRSGRSFARSRTTPRRS
jgi:two-component system chemotaxis response regulator CheB